MYRWNVLKIQTRTTSNFYKQYCLNMNSLNDFAEKIFFLSIANKNNFFSYLSWAGCSDTICVMTISSVWLLAIKMRMPWSTSELVSDSGCSDECKLHSSVFATTGADLARLRTTGLLVDRRNPRDRISSGRPL